MDENRLKHSLAVGRKMIEIGRERDLNANELQKLFILGYLHDIGYEFGKSTNHAKVGGEILRNSNYK